MAIFPGEEWNKEGGVQDKADSVIQPLVVTEGVVATFMGNDPNSSQHTALADPVKRPGQVGERVWEEMEVVGSNIVEDRGNYEVVNNIRE